MKTILGFLLLVGMSLSSVYAAELKLPIVRVFMHMPGDYSVMYIDVNKVVHAERFKEYRNVKGVGVVKTWINNYHSGWNGSVITQTIVADVPTDKPMYVQAFGDGNEVQIFIHIHSPKEISGGEWSTGGKYPVRGTTVVVE